MIDVQRLWLAVLMQAINDFTYSYERARLKPWFTSDNRDPGSFKWICDHLELDSSRLRRRIFAIIDAPVSKHLHSTLARVSEAELKALPSAARYCPRSHRREQYPQKEPILATNGFRIRPKDLNDLP
jgi:hypothetical protein